MPGAAVPEAAVDEHGDVEPGKDKVRANPAGGADTSQGLGPRVWGLGFGTWTFRLGTSRSERQRTPPPPSRDAIRPENLDQAQFGGFVAHGAKC